MGFRINTNIAAMNAHRNATQTNLGLDKSLNSLSSGLRINKAADDASGMTIADSLRSQANGLGQAIRNANDGIAVVQTADGALDEYINIVDRIRTLSIQAASDGQNTDSRMAIQRDVSALLSAADGIAKTTSFNGLSLLDGSYTDKNFQIGAYANETVSVSIDSARTASLGKFVYAEAGDASETSDVQSTALVAGALEVNGVDVGAAAAGTTAAGDNTTARAADSAWAVMNAINSQTSDTGVTATATTTLSGNAIAGGVIADNELLINGINIGAVTVSANDSTGTLVAAINKATAETNVSASLMDNGKLLLTSENGENIFIATAAAGTAIESDTTTAKTMGFGDGATANSLTYKLNDLTGADGGSIGLAGDDDGIARGRVTLESDNAVVISGTAEANAGFTADQTFSVANSISTVDVTTYDEAQLSIKKADHALAQLDRTRSNIGSTQNQLESTIRNISVTQVNVTAAESQIRDVDFAAESANFAKLNILAQSGSYAMSQANAVQQNVLRLLQ